jgi:thiol-disulfide isomerase/thioredoxin
MFRKIIYTLVISTVATMALDTNDLVGKEIQNKLNLESNKIYIIDFFASWCKSCKKEIPELSSLNDTIDKKNVKLIGIDVDEDIAKGQLFQKELRDAKKLNFEVVDDPKNEIVKIFNPVAFPAVFIIKDLKIVGTVIGAKDNIDEYILEGLKGLK